MKPTLSEKNIVIALFVMVLITFSLAQEDTKKMEKGFNAASKVISSPVMLAQLKGTGR